MLIAFLAIFLIGETVGRDCKSTTDCKGVGQFCNNNQKCACLSTHIDLNGSCKPVIYPGQYGCEDSRQCQKAFPGAVCNVIKRCQCPNGYVAKEFSCFKKIDPANSSKPPDDNLRLFAPKRRQTLPESPKLYASKQQMMIEIPNANLCDIDEVYIDEMGTCMGVREPGESCQYPQQCQRADHQSSCTGLQCECPIRSSIQDDRCVPQNQNCSNDGHTWVPETGDCKKIVKPGKAGCQYSAQCSAAFTGSFCYRNKCQCPSNLVPVHGTCGKQCTAGKVYSKVIDDCIPSVEIGGQCRYSVQCEGTNPDTICDKRKCACRSGKVFTEIGCAPKCARGETAGPDGICVQQNIVRGCRSTQVEYNGRCLNPVGIGQSCTQDSQCLGHSQCVGNICKCPSSMIIRNGSCRPKEALPTESCKNNEICTGNSFCLDGECVCVRSRSVIVNGRCRTPVTAGGLCLTDDEHCLGGAICQSGKCVCPSGSIASKTGECSTMRQAHAGEPCVSSQVCAGLATCVNGTCQCPLGMIIQDGVCRTVVQVGPGANCADGQICIGSSRCVTGVCRCPVNMMDKNGICTPIKARDLDGNCALDEHCPSESVCIDGTCQCPHGTISSFGRCISASESLGECFESSQCTGGSYCDLVIGLCVCPAGFTAEDNQCAPTFARALTAPTKRCVSNFDCSVGAKCIENKCHCPAGEIFVRGRCQVVLAEPGEPCTEGQTCTGSHVCVNGTCSCLPGEHSIDGDCVHMDSAGNESLFQTDYQQSNQHQQSSKIPANDNKTVNGTMNLTRVTLRTNRCSTDKDCGGGSFCSSQRCICPANMLMKDGMCQRIFPFMRERVGHLGGRCTDSLTCIARNTACHNGVCICMPGFRVFGSTECIPRSSKSIQASSGTTTIRTTTAVAVEDLEATEQMLASEVMVESSLDRNPYRSNIYGTESNTQQPSATTGAEFILNVSGGICNDTTLCLFFSLCKNGVCRCPIGSRISDTECRFIVDVSRLRDFEKALHAGASSSAVSLASLYGYTMKPEISSTVASPSTKAFGRQTSPPFWWRGTSTPPTELDSRPILAVIPSSMVTVSPPGAFCDEETVFCSNASICVDNLCVCRAGYVMLDGACVTRVYTRRCTASSQCPSGAHCIDGSCICASGTAISRLGFCIPIAKEANPGMPCSSTEVCTGHSECVDGVCTCPSDRKYIIDRQCVRSIRVAVRMKRMIETIDSTNLLTEIALGDRCTPNQSNLCAGNGICLNGQCTCPDGSKQINDQLCSPVKNSDRINCSMNPMICLDGTYCLNNECVCPVGQKCEANMVIRQKDSLDVQFRYASPGGPCIENDEFSRCTGNSICANNLCTCPSGERIINNVCSPIDSIGAPGSLCEPGYTKCTGGSACSDGFCKCAQQQISVNGYCVNDHKTAGPNEPCSHRIPCTGGSVCLLGLCVCPIGTIAIHGSNVCQPSMRINPGLIQYHPKTINYDTYSNDVIWSSGLGEPCMPPGKVCINGAQCMDGICKCPLGTLPLNDQCVTNYGDTEFRPTYDRPSGPGERCVIRANQATCYGGAICVNHFCICPADRVLSGNRCVDFIAYAMAGASCSIEGVICSGGSTCIDGLCRCVVGTVSRNGQCVVSNRIPIYTPILQPGARCTPLCKSCAQCGGGSVCLSGYCTCPLGMFSFMSRCLPIQIPRAVFIHYFHGLHDDRTKNDVVPPPNSLTTALPGDLCNSTSICTGGSTCIIGRCVCPPGYAANEEKNSCVSVLLNPRISTTVRKPGEVCNALTQCSGGSTCLTGICSCPIDSFPNKGRCTHRQSPKSLFAGSACATIDECQQGTSCFRGFCTCNDDVISDYCLPNHPAFSNGSAGHRCRKTAHKPSSCVKPLKCSIWGFCVCPQDYEGDGMGGCSRERQPSSMNYKYRKVITEQNECIDGSVDCSPDQKSSAIANFGCKESSECKPNYVCHNGNCICPDGMNETANRNACVITNNQLPPTSIGCDLNGGIICTGGSECIQNVCTCPAGFIFSGMECYPEFSRRLMASTSRPTHGWSSSEACPSSEICQLPDCYCSRSGLEIPNNLPANEVPQMIILTFDGPITDEAFVIYKQLLDGKHKNPNGCPITATFFVSMEYNNYDQTQWLLSSGHEIAVNSITHNNIGHESLERWRKEMVGLRDSLRHFSYANPNQIIGVRAPQLELGGDNQFNMMEISNFTYDNTMSVSNGPFWPQTLTFPTAWKCTQSGCPLQRHPFLWEIPINRFTVRGTQKEFTMLKDAVRMFDTPQDIVEMLEENLNRSYFYNRAPIVLTADLEFLNALPNGGAIQALEIFIQKVLKNSDIYFVSAKQALDWIRHPTRLLNVHNFDSWQCVNHMSKAGKTAPCEHPSSCSYTCDGGDIRTLRVCGACPRVHPKLGDPTGTGNSTLSTDDHYQYITN